ncbi:MAG TPA: hypothetical protein VIY48_19940 [Candidatus Paceibacterota bacterium]
MGVTGTPSGTITNITQGSLTLTYIGTAESVTTATSFDFGNFSAASSGLMIVVVVGRADNSPTISSISIGGTNGTVIDMTTLGLGANSLTGWGYRQVSSGLNDVTVTFSGSTGTNTAVAVGVWLLTGNVNDTPYAYDIIETQAVTTASLSHGAAPKSVTLFAAVGKGTADETINSFSGATAEAADDEIGASGRHRRFARYENATAAQVNRTETVTFSGTANNHMFMLASWV